MILSRRALVHVIISSGIGTRAFTSCRAFVISSRKLDTGTRDVSRKARELKEEYLRLR